MDPLHSWWSKLIYQFHEELMVRRHITRELSKSGQESEVLQPMLKYYITTLISTFSICYLIRKQPFSIRFVVPSFFFSLTFLYLQLFHEQKVFLSRGLENTSTGNLIRENYIKELPNHWMSRKFEKKAQILQDFHSKFHYRQEPLKKFENYAESRGFLLKIN